MNFGWDDEEQKLYRETLAFAEEKLGNDLESATETAAFDRDGWRACGDFGLTGLNVSADSGGSGFSALLTTRVMEAFGKGCEDMGLVFSVAAHLFACASPIDEYGTPEQKAAWLTKLATGEWVGANAITEAEAGSDAFSMQTRAVRDGDDFVISGEKSYVSNGPVCDVMVVYAVTNPKYGHLGLSAFIVERDTPGITVGKPFNKIGLTTSQTASVWFDEVRVPASSMLGGEGAGGSIFTGSMSWERTGLFAAYTGLSERLLEQSVNHVKERRRSDGPTGEHHSTANRIGEMKVRLELARLLTYRASWLRDEGKRASAEVAMAKVAASENAIQSARDAMQIFGGSGLLADHGLERALRDSVPSAIFSGTSEIQRNVMASELGL